MPVTALFKQAPLKLCQNSALSVVWRAFSILLLSAQQDWVTDEKGFKSCWGSLYLSKYTGRNVGTHISRSTALQYLQACAVPRKMSICTLAFLWVWLGKQKENPFCTTVRSIGNETHWRLEKSTATCASKAKHVWSWNHPPVLPTRKQKKLFSSLQKKRKKKRKDKMDTTLSWKPPLNSPGFLIVK